MRSLYYVVSALAVIGLAYWAYQENYRTQQAAKIVRQLERDIATEREALTVLTAEWAYLNRPDRLRALVEINFDRLGLLPLQPEQFGDVGQVRYPPPKFEISGLEGSVETSGSLEVFP
ncbi:MAG: cell division protein FtsL [Halocynthiibacter sp.]